MSLKNETTDVHIFHDGKIVRFAVRDDDGSWYVITRGTGTNRDGILDDINESQGAEIFEFMDREIRRTIEGRIAARQKT